ncbi:MAG: acetate--CoA ligase family protein, partial [Candidatus Aminicenantes bacterium]|nr:acetate--CoA ligase family protein [Candidatus Aminicenantes bacterium]
MARLYEYQSKLLLKEAGIRIPEGGVASSPQEVRSIAEELGKPVVIKMQVWVTGRAGLGGIRFADTPQEAEDEATKILGMKVKNYVVDRVIVEEKLSIKKEFFLGLVIDDASKSPLLVFSSIGGTGIEEIARHNPDKVGRYEIDVLKGLRDYEARNLVRKTGIIGKLILRLGDV